MTLEEYQADVLRTMNPSLGTDKEAMAYYAMGVSREASEAGDEVIKYIGQGHILDKDHIAEELGDTLWFLVAYAHKLGYTLNDIMNRNVDKRQHRYPDGFEIEKSVNRNK